MVSAGQAYSVSQGRNVDMTDSARLVLGDLGGGHNRRIGPHGQDHSVASGNGAVASSTSNQSGVGSAPHRAAPHRRLHASKKRGDGGVQMPRSGSAPPTALDLLRQAQVCRRQHRWACALAQYGKLLREHQGAVVTTALVAMAEIELRHMGRPGAALKHFDQYLGRRPSGSVAAEALYGKARALRALGRRAAEIQVLRSFVKRYPNAILTARVRDRLRSLGALR